MECVHVREHLPAFDEQLFSTEVLEHLEACPDCRTVLGEYRELQAGLSFLGTTAIQPPAWLLGTVTERVADRLRRRSALLQSSTQIKQATHSLNEHRAATAGSALGVALLAGAVLFGRSRRNRPVSVRPA